MTDEKHRFMEHMSDGQCGSKEPVRGEAMPREFYTREVSV